MSVILFAALCLAPRYSVTESSGQSWLVDPKGKRFVSMGVCCVTPGQTFADYNPDKPEYAAFRYYENGRAWAQDTVDRMQRWGFNTIGAWSDLKELRKAKAPNIHITPILHMGSTAGAPWRDMWDPVVVAQMDKIAKDQILPLKGDGRVIGYFSDNEMGWWYGAMFEWGWKGKVSRGKMVDLFQSRYRNQWKAVLQDFVPKGASSFASLRKGGQLYLRPGGKGIVSVQAWISILADRYYNLCNRIIKKYDPQALFLGDRYISNFYPEVAAASGKYVDVSSTNLNADWNDGSFARFYLPLLHKLTKKPVMITEYYACAMENRSGNKNDSSGFPTVKTQKDRARIFEDQTKYLLGMPYVVGAHWFQYSDEPKFGRPDGENYNMGLVDIDNRPYEELTGSSTSLDPIKLHESHSLDRASIRSHPTMDERNVKSLASWPRSEALIGSIGTAKRSDLYAVQIGHILYLALYWYEDRFAEAFYIDGKIPKQDHARLTVTTDGIKHALDLESSTALFRSLGVRNTVIFRFPVKSRAADIDATLSTRHRAYTDSWEWNISQ